MGFRTTRHRKPIVLNATFSDGRVCGRRQSNRHLSIRGHLWRRHTIKQLTTMDCGFYHCPNAPWNWLNALVHVGLLVFGRLDKKVTNNLNIKVQFMCVTDRVCVNKSGLNAKKVSTCDNRGGTCYSVRALIWVRGRVYAKLVNNQTFFF